MDDGIPVARDTIAAYLPTSFSLENKQEHCQFHQQAIITTFLVRWAFPTHFEGARSFLKQMLHTSQASSV